MTASLERRAARRIADLVITVFDTAVEWASARAKQEERERLVRDIEAILSEMLGATASMAVRPGALVRLVSGSRLWAAGGNTESTTDIYRDGPKGVIRDTVPTPILRTESESPFETEETVEALRSAVRHRIAALDERAEWEELPLALVDQRNTLCRWLYARRGGA